MITFQKTLVLILLIGVLTMGGIYVWKSPVTQSLGYGDNVNFIRGSLASSSFSSVSTTATRVLADNGGRIYARCSNIGTPNVFLALAGNASKSWGILIPASSSYEINPNNLYTGPIYAITQTGTTRVSCVEKTQ